MSLYVNRIFFSFKNIFTIIWIYQSIQIYITSCERIILNLSLCVCVLTEMIFKDFSQIGASKNFLGIFLNIFSLDIVLRIVLTYIIENYDLEKFPHRSSLPYKIYERANLHFNGREKIINTPSFHIDFFNLLCCHFQQNVLFSRCSTLSLRNVVEMLVVDICMP